jgi:hypothetical protein
MCRIRPEKKAVAPLYVFFLVPIRIIEMPFTNFGVLFVINFNMNAVRRGACA